MLGGGVISLIKELPMMITSFRDALKGYGQKATQVLRTDADMDPKWLIVGIVALIIFMALLPQIPVDGSVRFWSRFSAFFFVTVSSRLVVWWVAHLTLFQV